MRNAIAAPTLALLLLASGVVSAHAQLVYGRVVDKESGAGVATVTVQMLDAAGAVHRETVTDTSGWFRLRASTEGTYRVRAQMIGFSDVTSAPMSLDQAAQTELEIVLDRQAIVLEPVRVVAERTLMHGRLAEYFERAEWVRRTGMGRIYMRNDLEQTAAHSLSYIFNTVGRRLDCPMTYFLDGLYAERDYIEALPMETVEGVEIYRSRLEVPPEYQMRVPCAATFVWMRRDLPGRRMAWWRIVLSIGAIVGGLVLIRELYLGN